MLGEPGIRRSSADNHSVVTVAHRCVQSFDDAAVMACSWRVPMDHMTLPYCQLSSLSYLRLYLWHTILRCQPSVWWLVV